MSGKATTAAKRKAGTGKHDARRSRARGRGLMTRQEKPATVPIPGPVAVSRVLGVLCRERAFNPERFVSIENLARLTRLDSDTVRRVLPGVVLRTHAVLPHSVPGVGFVGFFLGDESWVGDAAIGLRRQADQLMDDADTLQTLSERLRAADSASDKAEETEANKADPEAAGRGIHRAGATE